MKCGQIVVTNGLSLRSLGGMTQQPQTPQPEGQQPNNSGFNAAGFQQDLTTKTISVNNAWIITGLGGLLLIGVFLPWATASIEFMGQSASESLNGLDKSFLVLVMALAIGALGALVALRKIPLWGIAGGAVAALIHLFFSISAYTDVTGDQTAAAAAGVDFSHGFGLWISLLGSLAVIGFAVYTYLKDKVDYVSTGPLFPQQNNQPPASQGPAA